MKNEAISLTGFLLVLGVLIPSLLFADMIEVRDRGFVDGKITNETETTIEFKDTYGHDHVFLKKDVLHFEKTTASSSPAFKNKYWMVADTWVRLRLFELEGIVDMIKARFFKFKNTPLKRQGNWSGL